MPESSNMAAAIVEDLRFRIEQLEVERDWLERAAAAESDRVLKQLLADLYVAIEPRIGSLYQTPRAGLESARQAQTG